ncbi:P-loop containing nucleoside triphosphate hydrolase protein [Choanephora cucurbitarum]|nr:P-loop containing nucleoside triphosphate hydrolase protein [Choanephora cucurbitarum]
MPKRRATNDNDDITAKKNRNELPEPLAHLFHMFQQLNLFCAFCHAHLETSMTLEHIQKSIPSLTLDDLVGINVIMPEFVKLNMLSDQLIEVEFGKKLFPKTNNTSFHSTTKVKSNAVQKLIEQQNKLFTQSLTQFMRHCQNEHVDVKHHLKLQIDRNRPVFDYFDDLDDALFEQIDTPKSIQAIVQSLPLCHFYDNQLKDTTTFPKREAMYDPQDSLCLSDQIRSALDIQQLYQHQSQAIQHIMNGKDLIVSTSTASGKSLIYQIPVIEQLLSDVATRAIYLFPTKALAQDQKRAFLNIIQHIPQLKPNMIATFDGDTPSDQRFDIRKHARVILTNPDMLHHAILPNNTLWRDFLFHLRYVVIDELHVYHGLFGTHVAWIMRRLRRLCSQLGNHHIQFISCSATIHEPDKHMKSLLGVDEVAVVDQDGAPHGQKEFIVWNPPLQIPSDPNSGRKSAIVEGAHLFEYLIENNIRTIAFCKIRKSCELLMKQVRDSLIQKQRKDLVDKIASYRGGYTADQRRTIEQQMFNGQLVGIIATNALELGIDIGSLDAVLMVGVPWSISALWQQSGRSGRRNADSLSIVICDNNPLDQYYANHPKDLLTKRPDTLGLDLENDMILANHLQCAAEESPIDSVQDQTYFGPLLPDLCHSLLTSIGNQLYRPDPKYRPYPSQYVSIRNMTNEEDAFVVVDVTGSQRSILEQVQIDRVGFELYEGAIFIHQGKTFLVEECNLDKKYARVHLVRVDWTTRQRDHTDVDILSTLSSKPIAQDKRVFFGKVKVVTVVFGYHRLDKRGRIMDTFETYMDPIVLEANGVWADVPRSVLSKLKELEIDPMAAIHSASHCLISLLPKLNLAVAARDLRTECKSPYAARARPFRIAIYETHSNGTVAQQAYNFFDRLIEKGMEQIDQCSCEKGCPSCIHSTFCSEQNQVSSKKGAWIVLDSLRT